MCSRLAARVTPPSSTMARKCSKRRSSIGKPYHRNSKLVFDLFVFARWNVEVSDLMPARIASMQRVLLREPPRPDSVRSSPHAHWFVVGAVCTGAFMGQLDASIVTVALPHIGQSLQASAATVQWVALSYMLVLLAPLMFAGQLADRLGGKTRYR